MITCIETYYELLDWALKRGTTLNDKDYEEVQPLTDEYENKLIYKKRAQLSIERNEIM